MKTPQEIVGLLGGNKAAASALGVSPQAVSNWLRRGAIPPSQVAGVMAAAKALKIQISYADLLS